MRSKWNQWDVIYISKEFLASLSTSLSLLKQISGHPPLSPWLLQQPHLPADLGPATHSPSWPEVSFQSTNMTRVIPCLNPPAAPQGLRVKFRLPGVAHKSCMLWPCSPHQCSVLTSLAQCQGCVMPSSTSRPLSTLFSLVQLFPLSDFYLSSPFFSFSIIASGKSFLSWVRCLPLQPSPVLPPILAPRTQRNRLATCSSLACKFLRGLNKSLALLLTQDRQESSEWIFLAPFLKHIKCSIIFSSMWFLLENICISNSPPSLHLKIPPAFNALFQIKE